MKHLSYERISQLSAKVWDCVHMEQDELENMEHIQNCQECEKIFSRCLDVLDFMSPENLEDYFFQGMFEGKTESMESKIIQGKSENLLYKIKMLADQVSNRFQIFLDKIAEGLPVFENMEEFSFARGTDDFVELGAEDSVIRYDSNGEILTVALDCNRFSNRNLAAVIRTENGDEIKFDLKDNGFGMLETEFTNVKGKDIELVIFEK